MDINDYLDGELLELKDKEIKALQAENDEYLKAWQKAHQEFVKQYQRAEALQAENERLRTEAKLLKDALDWFVNFLDKCEGLCDSDLSNIKYAKALLKVSDDARTD